MAYSVAMPALGESVTEGTVTRWLKQEGDTVEVDEPLVEVSTDKVDTEIPSPATGVLQRIVVPEDETVQVGAELAVIGDSSGDGGRNHTEWVEPPQQPSAQPTPSAGDSGTPVTMPALGESVTEGTVTRWLKQVGDTVEADEPLLEVSTDKVDTEIPSPVAGTVVEIVVAQDETVKVGAKLAMVGDSSGARATAAPDQPDQSAQPPSAEPQRPKRPAPAPEADESGGAPYVTPLVRKLAA
ncbi:MAG TPA: biotin/lipoyl-containing protein, partial [Actinophytocola sp.]|nr:biotin/lipoyl-containing protein [Actinophytocola sp.]